LSTGQEQILPMHVLVEGCLKNDRFSQASLYKQLAPKMFVVCLRYSGTKEDAEEILQEGFIKVFDHMHQYNKTGAFEGWVRKIMVNCALQKYRSKPMLYAVPHNDITDVDFLIPENTSASIATKELLVMINSLSPNYKMVFNLYVFEGMKHKEIAELLNIAEGTSKSNLSDARKILQKMVANSLQTAPTNINYL
jgi:RNA polymerase sigma factor (sigma-70 family)